MSFNEQRADAPVEATVRRLHIEFTGSGSEYFRIWIVNVLLLMVTLGFYWPWAKVRRQRYFWGNTLVDGDPLGFHGDPKQMFKGWALVAVLFAMYNVASNASAVASLVAFIALAALWPALWRSSIRFRMANTSWRGLRFRFVGSLRDAYLAHLPPFVVALPMVLLSIAIPEDPEQAPPEWVMASFGGAFVLLLLTLPWLLWRMKAYQHRHYALGPLQTDFRASVRSFYLLAIKPFLLFAAVFAMVVWLVWSLVGEGEPRSDMAVLLIGAAPLVFLAFWVFLFLGIGPWITTRLQNLVWTKTGNGQMRFISQLRFRDMFWLSLKNALLIGITLGLYWPFAKVAMARLRLEAVHVRTITDMQALLAAGQERPQEAAGDAAGDFFGLDVGL
ncbi:YjgN family protein [Hydrogenophaga pseudoflava]|uniref:YjgN family protein n=1 Tax=Hydrogenophaga pseudoflava TaxID=47421 RepID=UPI0027E4D26D|nr:YjgN family protein [Hydrogenophaga pseudoflava]MDQ7746835.1 YjgN family protein [Hydrogenophaga pseudoflava]